MQPKIIRISSSPFKSAIHDSQRFPLQLYSSMTDGDIHKGSDCEDDPKQNLNIWRDIDNHS